MHLLDPNASPFQFDVAFFQFDLRLDKFIECDEARVQSIAWLASVSAACEHHPTSSRSRNIAAIF